MRHLDLELLRTFLCITELGTLVAAAQRLHRTQAALTQQMQRLEAQAGLPLFEKQGRNKRLTRHGAALLPYAKHLLAIHDEALRTLHDGDLIGAVRLGAPHDVADNLLPSLLGTIARWSPRLKLEIHMGRSPFLMESLLRGEIDLTISTRDDPQLEGVILRQSPTVWIAAVDYVHDASAPIPLILADEPSLHRKLALEALEQAGVRWRQSYVAPSLVGIKAAIQAGLGVTARGVELLGPDMRVLGKQDGLPPLPPVTYYLWMRPDVINSVTRQVFDMLKRSLGLASPRADTAAT